MIPFIIIVAATVLFLSSSGSYRGERCPRRPAGMPALLSSIFVSSVLFSWLGSPGTDGSRPGQCSTFPDPCHRFYRDLSGGLSVHSCSIGGTVRGMTSTFFGESSTRFITAQHALRC